MCTENAHARWCFTCFKPIYGLCRHSFVSVRGGENLLRASLICFGTCTPSKDTDLLVAMRRCDRVKSLVRHKFKIVKIGNFNLRRRESFSFGWELSTKSHHRDLLFIIIWLCEGLTFLLLSSVERTTHVNYRQDSPTSHICCLPALLQFMYVILSFFLLCSWKFMTLPAINIKLEIEPFLMLPLFFSSRSRFGLRTVGLSGVSVSETKWTHWRRLPTSRTALERNLFNRFQTPMRSTRRIHIIIIGRQRCHLR